MELSNISISIDEKILLSSDWIDSAVLITEKDCFPEKEFLKIKI